MSAIKSRRLVSRESSILRGDGGRFTTPLPSRLEARTALQHFERLQRAADGLGNVLNAVIGEFENELAGLDLGQVEHVTEQMLAVGLKPFEDAQHLLGRLAISAVRH